MAPPILGLPNAMIRRRTDRRGLRLEAILVVVAGLLGAAGVAYVGSQALGAAAGDNSQLRFTFIGQALGPLLAIALVWIGYTVVSHFLSSQFRGRGPISRLFRTSAWAVVPIGIWYLLRSIVTLYLFLGIDFPANPEGISADERFQSIMDLGYDGSVLYTAVVFAGVLFVVWSWYLLADAVSNAKGVPPNDARKVAAVPAGIYGLYVLWTALGTAGIV